MAFRPPLPRGFSNSAAGHKEFWTIRHSLPIICVAFGELGRAPTLCRLPSTRSGVLTHLIIYESLAPPCHTALLMLKFYPKMSEMGPEARAALAAQQEEQRQKEVAASRQAQRTKHERARAAEAAAMREKLMRRGPGRPRKPPGVVINAKSLNITIGTSNLNVVGSNSQVSISQQPPHALQPSVSSSDSSFSSSSPPSSSSPSPSTSSSPPSSLPSSSSPTSAAFLSPSTVTHPVKKRGKEEVVYRDVSCLCVAGDKIHITSE